MADVHQETVLRLQSLSDRGYSVKTIWECEWQKCKNHDPETAEIVAGYDLEEPLSPRDAFFGGRTNAVRLHYEVKEHAAEQINIMIIPVSTRGPTRPRSIRWDILK